MILGLDHQTVAAVHRLLEDLRTESFREADQAWKKRKGPIAAYRLEIAVHVALLCRATRGRGPAPAGGAEPYCAAVQERAKARSNRATVRNPLLRLRAIDGVLALSPIATAQLRAAALHLAGDCSTRAEHAWQRRRVAGAVMWRTAGVYAGHLARALLRAHYGQYDLGLAAA